MRKLFLTFVASLLCSIVSFAQITPTQPQGSGTQQSPYFISTASEFLWIINDNDAYYKQTADINLGDLGQKSAAIISSFSGTYDGNGHTITYQAQFSASSQNIGLFGSVSKTIKNLTLNASVTISDGGTNWVNVGLLCGTLTGTLENCHATNCNINSVIATNNGHGISVGLLVGKMSNGTLNYSSGVGNVTGNGRVGGLVGEADGSVIYGCSFIGEVVAVAVGDKDKPDAAGGICGEGGKNTTINLCYVNADITATDVACGIVCKSNQSPTVTNCYAAGTVNGMNAGNSFEITNANYNSNSNNWYDDQITNTLTPEYIAGKLNDAADDDPNINFGVASDEVIFGVVSTTKVCETPTNLTIANNAGTFTASWTSANANNTITESHWHWSLTGGDAYDNGGDASSASVNLGTLPASSTPYTFMVYTDCSDSVNGLTSSAISQQFYVDCPAPTGLTASNITDNGFTISWTASVDCQLTVNGINYEIVAGNPMTKQITGLNPETQYTAIVKAKCGNAYVKQASINVTTARLYAPTGLAVTTSWNGSAGNNGGSATISWTPIEGLTYEVNTENNTQTSPYQISNTLPQASYTAKVRAKKGDKYSDWASIPYTVSTPNAPSNPIVTYQHTAGEKFNVSISWTPGTEPNSGWRIELNAIFNSNAETNSCVITNQNAGSASIVQIIEKVGEHSTSKPLNVPIQVPCLDASAPTSIVPALNSVTFNFDPADTNTRKIVIGMQDTTTNATSVTIDSLTEGTSYAYEIREYCNVATNTYSSISSTFSTLACNPVANLSVSNVGQDSATVSWTSQSSGVGNLEYKVVVNEGESTIKDTTIQNTTINLTGLTLATTYTVRVSEQCGTEEGNWGEERTITFTTQGAKTYISAKTGNFSDGATWIGGQIPSIAPSDTASITINAGHTVTLDVKFVLRNNITFTNNGVLSIGQAGELINTTNNNVGGIVEIVTPVKAINKWTFIGAPFGNGYKLEAVKPVSGSDIAMVKYNYTSGAWSNSWATINTSMEAAEGTFAWPFYGGAVTFTTYGDVINNAYDYSQSPKYALNNGNVTVTKTITASSGGNWMALSNPYPAKLSVSKFLTPNTSVLQGGCTYSFNGSSFDIDDTTSGNIGMTEGFFVNCRNTGSNTITFTKSQLTNYPSSSSKSSVVSSEFIELTLVNGKDKVRVYFAHNEDAEQGYDIFDANKMFATTGVAEPYFVTDGIALIKEEVRDLPYYATMNVRSQQDTAMNFVLTNLPEGYAVSIIDGEEVIDLVEGGVYSTEIASGENADRFKVLVKKNVGLADVEDLDVRITNSNRHITITAQENVRTEVYNTLGQKVFETEETNFVLSGVASGAYVVKVQGAKASKSQKIVVE